MHLLAALKRRRTGRFLLRAVPALSLAAVLISALIFTLDADTALGADTAASEPIATIADDTGDLAAQLSAAGVSCLATDYVSEGVGSAVSSLWISPGSSVAVACGGESWSLTSYGETVGTLLARLNLSVGADDLLIAGHSPLEKCFQVNLVRRKVETQTSQETIPRAITRTASDSLYAGQERVTQEGSDGLRLCTYQTVTLNGSFAHRTLTDALTIAEPVAQVVSYGTRPLPVLSPLSVTTDFPVSIETNEAGGGVITTYSGQQLAYTQVLSVKAYAYTTEFSKRKGTAVGTTARVGAIAVDPKIIPYGTRMFIQTADGTIIYGIATAEDCGNFSGNVVDLFFDTRQQCLQFGKRTCDVYILAD